MNVGFADVSGPADLWINIAAAVDENLGESLFFDPTPQLRTKIAGADMDDHIVEFGDDDRSDIPFDEHDRYVRDYYRRELYIDIPELEMLYHNYLTKLNQQEIDVFVMWNDYHIGKIAARELGIETVFLEKGYAPKTLQIDTEGVNKNSSINDLNYDEIVDMDPVWGPEQQFNIDLVPTDFGASKGAVAAEWLADTDLWDRRVNTFLDTVKRIVAPKLELGDTELPNCEFLFVPLQVESDTQILYNTDLLDDMGKFVHAVQDSAYVAGLDVDLAVKEHPHDPQILRYQKLKRSYDSIHWYRTGDVADFISKSEIVVTINSSVGFQAIKRGVPTITLGEAMYNSDPLVESVSDLKQLPDAISLSYDKDSKPTSHVNSFLNNVFVDGGVSDFNEQTIQCILSFIVNKCK